MLKSLCSVVTGSGGTKFTSPVQTLLVLLQVLGEPSLLAQFRPLVCCYKFLGNRVYEPSSDPSCYRFSGNQVNQPSSDPSCVVRCSRGTEFASSVQTPLVLLQVLGDRVYQFSLDPSCVATGSGGTKFTGSVQTPLVLLQVLGEPSLLAQFRPLL